MKKVVKTAENFLLAFGFVFLFSKTTSPLFDGLKGAWDSSMFVLVGRGITEGLVPYRDLLENKGPLFFFIEAIPQYLVSGTIGICITQSILLFIELQLIEKMCKYGFDCIKIPYMVKLPFLLMLSLVYIGGNMAEEYNLFINICCLFCTIYIFNTETNDKQNCIFYVLGGVMTGAIFLIKMNDAAGTIAMCIMVFLHCGRKKQLEFTGWIKYAFKFLFLYLAGMIFISIPVCIYYYHNDAMWDMIYGYLTLNFSMVYQGGRYYSILKRLVMLFQPYGFFSIFPLIFILISCFYNWKNKEIRLKRIALLFIGSCISVATYTHITGFRQHLIPSIIVWLLMTFCILQDFAYISGQKLIRGASLLVCGGYVFFYFASSFTVNIFDIMPHDFKWESEAKEVNIMDEIPEDCRDSIFIIGKRSDWFYKNNIYPAYKWLNLESFIGHMGMNIAEDFEETLKSDPVKCLIIPDDIEAHSELLTQGTLDYIRQNYIFSSQIDKNYIYILDKKLWKHTAVPELSDLYETDKIYSVKAIAYEPKRKS